MGAPLSWPGGEIDTVAWRRPQQCWPPAATASATLASPPQTLMAGLTPRALSAILSIRTYVLLAGIGKEERMRSRHRVSATPHRAGLGRLLAPHGRQVRKAHWQRAADRAPAPPSPSANDRHLSDRTNAGTPPSPVRRPPGGALKDRPSAPTTRLSPRQRATEAERRARLTRRLRAWLAGEPAPADILDGLYQVADRLERTLPGGLTIVTADVFLDIFCQCLLSCDLADLLAVWPSLHAAPGSHVCHCSSGSPPSPTRLPKEPSAPGSHERA